MALHVVGNICVDDTFYVERLPRPGEDGECRRDGPWRRRQGSQPGGGGVARRRRGGLQRRARDDADAGVFLRAALGAELPLDGLVVLDTPTDRSTILVDRTGENVGRDGRRPATAFDPTGRPSWPGRGDHLLMQGNLRADVTRACLSRARDDGATTILNPSPLGEGLVPEADVIVVNAGGGRG